VGRGAKGKRGGLGSSRCGERGRRGGGVVRVGDGEPRGGGGLGEGWGGGVRVGWGHREQVGGWENPFFVSEEPTIHARKKRGGSLLLLGVHKTKEGVGTLLLWERGLFFWKRGMRFAASRGRKGGGGGTSFSWWGEGGWGRCGTGEAML